VITPYYDRAGITLYCADMLSVELPSADLVLTDPPYAEETHAGARTHAKEGAPRIVGGKRHLIGNAETLLDFDSITEAELRAYFDRIGTAARAWVISFMDWRHIVKFEAHPPALLRFVRFGIWVKPNGSPQFTGDRPGTGWEGVAHMHRADAGRMRWNGGGHHAVYTHPKVNGNHKTAKPIRLIAELIRLYSQRGDLILDPFCGGGVTLVVARLLGRRAVGIERDERHCAAAVQWLESGAGLLELAPPQPSLFEGLPA
jgi:site-specific DNA-methyltransferase (adenine-specific)